MRIGRKMTALILMPMWLAAACCLGGCASRVVPLKYRLDTPQNHLHAGTKLVELGKYDNALHEFQLAKELDPAFSKAYAISGLVWAYNGDFKKAFKEIRKARELARNDEEKVYADVVFIRVCTIGRESADSNWLSLAESAFREAVAISPGCSEVYYYTGLAYKAAFDFTKARDLFKKVLEINDTHIAEAKDALREIGRH
ncbi:MAG: tetratricopeptide repeat protein [Deltaproteobacteria bacterium]|nr:tetratricopeptide repeat protein [Deltaproteobacteria bacterium]RLB90523.1 MAG: hypothetical protein DRH10_03835 [Deltaproteobacteria bacterium]RLB94598.1 MAG: hypothetical protein DRH50_06140 [Deltaproteobacteria bacterium]RLC11658.1 MAG: hypothetical protein DRH43_03645 [Deltaproteobacteria bacterium]